MIDQVIDKILKAESEADTIVKDAELKAGEIASSANIEIDAMELSYTQDTKSKIDSKISDARAEAEKKAAEIACASQAEAENIKAKAEKNISAIAEMVAEAVLRGRI